MGNSSSPGVDPRYPGHPLLLQPLRQGAGGVPVGGTEADLVHHQPGGPDAAEERSKLAKVILGASPKKIKAKRQSSK